MLDRGSLLPGRLVYVVMIPSSAAVSPTTNTNMYIRLWTIRTAAITKRPTFLPLVLTLLAQHKQHRHCQHERCGIGPGSQAKLSYKASLAPVLRQSLRIAEQLKLC
ncbi:hypothetical protein F5890DRAFT_190967 [Lentinula detonsa]|uniref:Uncharacterized protein n=1 Tax=Lentinula detonsa TaxID=2804962 RepID=A0AA38PXF7_9AGAR|nr:hypothetical protein F5890DRAFT_190967 [Lentinula detonsa]